MTFSRLGLSTITLGDDFPLRLVFDEFGGRLFGFTYSFVCDVTGTVCLLTYVCLTYCIDPFPMLVLILSFLPSSS